MTSLAEPGEDQSQDPDIDFDIAIIGYSGRFPGASDVESYWQNLAAGVESITWFSDRALEDAGVPPEILGDPNFVKAAPVLENADLFDAKFFGYSPREARLMDPQQRVLLESAHAAMEHGGYNPESYEGRIGVFAGTAMNTYLINSGVISQFSTDYLPTLLGNDKDFVATRIAYKLGLNGPAMTVQTACSTSLVALHIASQSLLSRESDMALVGAMAIRVPLATGHLYEPGSVFTPDGHCRTFDANANGTLFGSGGGVVLIKRLSDAIEAGDTIHAVVKGTAVNNDGATKSDFTAPSVTTQAEAITEALAAADVDADTVSYVEAHGTGTYLGDPIEIEALTRAFRNDTSRNQFCGIGSVKPNIGHLDAAAGMAGLLKVVKAIEHRQLPPTINFTAPNPQIDFPSTPFRVVEELTEWRTDNNAPLRAGLTSLGMGGTNAHVVLEEPPSKSVNPPSNGEGTENEILVLSARTESALLVATNNLADHLDGPGKQQHMSDIAHTLQVGRKHLNYRRSVVGATHSEAASLLRSASSDVSSTTEKTVPRQTVFLFPGGGMQHPEMGKGLYESNDVYRQTVDECAKHAKDHLGIDIRDVIFGAEDSDADLDRTDMFMPAMFATCYANARMWMSMGVQPVALAGHSLGEYVAATISGVFSVADAVRLVIRRGQLGRSVSGGVMFAMASSAEEVRPHLVPGAELSVINGPQSCVVSGTLAAVAELEKVLAAHGIEGRRLRLQEAYHCSMLDPILDDFAKDVADVTRNAPQIPVASNISGTWLTDEEATSVDYWVQHLRQPVRFDRVFASVGELGSVALLEAGPNQSMVSMARQHPALKGVPTIASSRRFTDDTPDEVMASRAAGKLWEAGVDLDFDLIGGAGRRRVPLPTYPFESQHYWFERPEARTEPVRSVPTRISDDPSDWVWQLENQTKTLSAVPTELPMVVIGANETELGRATLVALGPDSVGVDAVEIESAKQRLDELAKIHNRVLVVDLIGLSGAKPVAEMMSDHVRLIHILGAQATIEIDYSVVLDSSPKMVHSAAAATGPALIAGKEYEHIRSRLIEVDSSAPESAKHLAVELRAASSDAVASITGDLRTVPTAVVAKLAQGQLPQGGVYLISGGLGGLGLGLAEYLVRNRSAKVALISRRSLPPQDEWNQHARNHPEATVIQRLNQLGSDNVAVFSADVSDGPEIASVFDEVERRFGSIDGVFHAAGVVDDALIAMRAPDQRSLSVIGPKTDGVQALHESLAKRGKGFLALFSSKNALLAPAGQIDYVTANNFMDRFARHNTGAVKVVSIGWPGWRDAGIIADMTAGAVKEKAMATGIDSSEGFELLERLVLSDFTHLAVSPTRFDNDLSAASASQLTAHAEKAVDKKLAVSGGLNQAEKAVATYFTDLLGVNNPLPEDSFFDLGGTSLVAVKLFNRIEADFGLELTLDMMVKANTVRELGSLLASRRPDLLNSESAEGDSDEFKVPALEPFKSLVELSGGGDDLTTHYTVHGHGGNVVGLLQLAQLIGSDRPVFGLQSIGLDGGELDLTIEQMASRYIEEIREHQPEGPYTLSGYCMGGVIAFEMAQQLIASGEEPPTVVLLDSYPQEHLIQAESQTSKLGRIASNSAARAAREAIHRRGFDSFGDYALGRVKAARSGESTFSGAVETASRQQGRLDRVAKANSDAYYAYQAKPYPGDVILIRPERRIGHVDNDPSLGWNDLANNVDVRFLCKFRFEMFVEPGLSEFGELMKQVLHPDS